MASAAGGFAHHEAGAGVHNSGHGPQDQGPRSSTVQSNLPTAADAIGAGDTDEVESVSRITPLSARHLYTFGCTTSKALLAPHGPNDVPSVDEAKSPNAFDRRIGFSRSQEI
jgi:hypothetical protein